MGIVDYIAIAVIVLIVGAALFYIVRAKKHGQKCIGCPYAKHCNRNSCSCADKSISERKKD
jgi:hypothetical protein